MSDKKMTAEEIFSLIENKSVSKETGVNLIKNYGIQQQKDFISSLQEEYPAYSEKIMVTISKINEQLDEMLKAVLEKNRQ